MPLADVHRAPAHLRAHAAAEEERVEIGALDEIVAAIARAEAHRELGAERDGRVPLGLDGDLAHLGLGDGLVARAAVDRREDRLGLAELHLDGLGQPGAARERRADRFARAVHDLREHHRAIVDRDARVLAAVVDAEHRTRADALDGELPCVVVEAHERLAARGARQLGEREPEVAQDARGVALRDARGHVGPFDEDVEDLADAARAGAAMHAGRGQLGGVVGAEGGGGGRTDEDLEGTHLWGARLAVAVGKQGFHGCWLARRL